MRGLTYNGVHTSELNLFVTSSERGFLPAPLDRKVQVTSGVGTVLIPDTGKSDITVNVEFTINPTNSLTVYDIARNVKSWLEVQGRKPLIFDDDPGFAYVAKYENAVNLEHVIKFGKFNVSFNCLPDMIEVD